MRHEWKATTLGSVAQIGGGNSAPQKDELFTNGIHPFFRTSDAGKVRFGEMIKSVDCLNEEGIKGLRLFPKGTILLPKSGASTFLNHRVMLGVDGFVSSHLATVIGDEAKTNQQYLLYFLTTVLAQDLIQDHAYPSLKLSDIAGIPIFLPSLAEQQSIVAILDEAFEAIATARTNAEKNLQNARALFNSHLQSIFTKRDGEWKLKTLEEVSIIFGRGKSRHRPRNEPALYGGKYPFIQTGDIRNSDHFITEYSQTYNEAGLAQSKLWPKGTICITIAANIAETGILDFDACFPDSVIGVVTNPQEADIDYVEYLLQSFKVRIQALGKGSAQANINMGTFEFERFPFPSVDEQKRIVIKLNGLREETQRLENIYQKKIAALDDLKKSLLHQAFSGELSKDFKTAFVIPFPTVIKNIEKIELHAGVLAMTYQLHEKNKREKYVGHVKAEKTAHMIESLVGIDLGRDAYKDAAGPNDAARLKEVEEQAEKAGYFSFKQVDSGRYVFNKLPQFESLITRTRQALGERCADVDHLLELMLPMDKRKAELFATVYAAWNNLLLLKKSASDEQIVQEAREEWHPDKMDIPREEFFSTLAWIRQNDVIPQGRGKLVGPKNSLGELLVGLDN